MPGGGGNQSPAAQAEYQRSTMQARRNMIQSIDEEVRKWDTMGRTLAKRNEEIKKMETSKVRMLAGYEQEHKLEQKINKAKEGNIKLTEIYMQKTEQLHRSLDIRERNKPGTGLAQRMINAGMYEAADRQMSAARAGGTAGGGGGPGGIMGALGGLGGGGIQGLIAKVFPPLAAIGTGVAIAQAIEKATKYRAGFPARLEEARGTAMEQGVTPELQSMYSGTSVFETLPWMQQRKKAEGIAAQQMKTTRMWDLIKGAVTPNFMASDETRLAWGTGEQGQQYESLKSAQQNKIMREAFENLKKQDPQMKLTMETYAKRMGSDLALQRALGLTDRGMYAGAGFLYRGQHAGFRDDQMMGMSGEILGAGGSARMGQQSQFGLQMQRMGMTNAGGVLGTLSGGLQNPESTKRATIGIISEAFKIGLDNADYVEEQRRFVQAAAQVIGRTGAETPEDQDRLARTLGMFMGSKTVQGVNAAQGAYEEYQQRGRELGGRRGAMRLMSAMHDPILGQLDSRDLANLLGQAPENLTVDDPEMQARAIKILKARGEVATPDKIKAMSQQIIGNVGQITANARLLLSGAGAGASKDVSGIRSFMQQQPGMDIHGLYEQFDQGKIPTDVTEELGDLQKRIRLESKQDLNKFEMRSRVGEFFGMAPGVTAEDRAGTQKRLDEMTRKGDIATAAQAEDYGKVRLELNKLTFSLSETVDKVNAFGTAVSGIAGTAHAQAQERVKTGMHAEPFSAIKNMINYNIMNPSTSSSPTQPIATGKETK